jgi:hypothetical protein
MCLLEPKGGGGGRSVGLFFLLFNPLCSTWSSWQSWEKAEICLAILMIRLMPRFVRLITLNKEKNQIPLFAVIVLYNMLNLSDIKELNDFIFENILMFHSLW